MKFEESQKWLERAKKVCPYPYTQTFSKGADQFVQGVSPIYARHGKGPYLYDIDGNRFLDLIMGLMPVILGYGMDARIDSAPVYSLPTTYEVELSEKLCKIIPCAEMVRFGKNGSDVTTAAVRLARAITGRDLVLQCGYHGWHDWYIGNTWRNAGVPESTKKMTVPFGYNSFLSERKRAHGGEKRIILEKFKEGAACVIMEPVNFEVPRDSFLQKIRQWCDKTGTILIFDEMITGFRFPVVSAQEFFGVTPDLACFGKSMANGWPISAIVGKKEYMEHFKDIHFSFTFGTECMSIAAALTTIKFIQRNDVVPHLWEVGALLKGGLKSLIEKHGIGDIVKVEGFNVWPKLVTRDNIIKSFISQQLVKNGILWLESFNLSYAHKPRHIEKVLSTFDEIFFDLTRFDLDDLVIEGTPIPARSNVRSWQDQ